MTDPQAAKERPAMQCDRCKFRQMADKSNSPLLGRLWVWHTSFCPGWKRYVKARFEHGEQPPGKGHRRGYWGG
jgi:hypothetical protein